MNALEEALYDKLAGSAAIAAAVGTRIYRQAAPPGASHPLIVYAHHAGGDENETPVDSLDVHYRVTAISAESADEAGDIEELIRTALHRAALTVPGWEVFWLARGNQFRLTETDAGVEGAGRRYWHAGAFYHLRLDKA